MPPPRLVSALGLLLAIYPVEISAQCGGSQNFPDTIDEFVEDITPGVPTNRTLCPQHWMWYRVQSRRPAPYNSLTQQGTSWSEVLVEDVAHHTLSIALDAGYDLVSRRFTTLSFLVVNGTPPSNPGILRSDPYTQGAFSAMYHTYTQYTDRETLAFGFNDTLGGTCTYPLDEWVYMGVQCVHPLGDSPGPCEFNLTVTALPHTLHNGMAFDAYLPMIPSGAIGAPRHYFAVALGDYETLSVRIERQGDGQPLYDAYGEPQYLGFAGGVYAQHYSSDSCPSNTSSSLIDSCLISLNDTSPCVIGDACSDRSGSATSASGGGGGMAVASSSSGGASAMVLAIEANVGTRPPTEIDEEKSPYRLNCEPQQLGSQCKHVYNLVDRHGLRPERSEIDVSSKPRYNVPSEYIPVNDRWEIQTNNLNELRPDRGVYRLSVHHLQYAAGALLPGETRPGCVGYGQWRYYTIRTTGATDASLTVHVRAASGRGVGGVYVRQGARPSESAYLAMAERGTPHSLPQLVTVSPCDLNVSTVWHLGVMLEDQQTAVTRGVPPTQFSLSVNLENAVLDSKQGAVNPRGGDTAALAAKGVGGDGFACCGAFKYFLVPSVASHLSLRAELTVTRGVARALYLKPLTCPDYAADVRDDACVAQCTVSWLTRYNSYDGSSVSTSSAISTVPNGLGEGCPAACPADLRAAGNWYVGVQALGGVEAEFSLAVSVVEPPEQEAVHECNPREPECRPPMENLTLASAAPMGLRGRRPRRHQLLLHAAAVGREHGQQQQQPNLGWAVALGIGLATSVQTLCGWRLARGAVAAGRVGHGQRRE